MPVPKAVKLPFARMREALENPVMERELRSRLRGGKSYWLMLGYTLLVAGGVLNAYPYETSGLGAEELNERAAALGRTIWGMGCLVQALLLPLVMPGFTAGAITLERERDNLDLLLLTHQTPLQVCWGKYAAGVRMGLTLVLCSIPPLSVSLMLGGVSPLEMAASVAVLVSTGLAASAVGLAASSMAPKTSVATTWSYLGVGAALVGVPCLLAFLDQLRVVGSNRSNAGNELGVLLQLATCFLVTLPLAILAALGLYGVRCLRQKAAPTRSWWLLTAGLAWAVIMLTLFIPGMNELLLSGALEGLLVFHPIFAIQAILSPDWVMMNSLREYQWVVCAGASLGLAGGLFLLAVRRVRKLRVN